MKIVQNIAMSQHLIGDAAYIDEGNLIFRYGSFYKGFKCFPLKLYPLGKKKKNYKKKLTSI